MPARKMSSPSLKELALKEMNFPAAAPKFSVPNCFLLFIILVYGLTVGCNVYQEINESLQENEEESKKCLVDFQEKNCNALKLDSDGDGTCLRLFNCLQKDKDEGVISKSLALISISINELKESALIPGAMILMVLVYQIMKSLQREEAGEKYE